MVYLSSQELNDMIYSPFLKLRANWSYGLNKSFEKSPQGPGGYHRSYALCTRFRLCHVLLRSVNVQWYPQPSRYYSISQEICTRFCFAVLCCGFTLTDFPISIRLTSLALWQSNDCPSASKATLMNMDKYFMWIHYERLHNHNKAKHNKTVCIFLGIYCILVLEWLYYCESVSGATIKNVT